MADAVIARAAAQRLVVGLVRGLHGLRGAVRVEVLTDRPEERFARGAVLFRRGLGRPADDHLGGHRRRAGMAGPLPRGPVAGGADALRETPISRSTSSPGGARARRGLLARGHRASPCATSTAPSSVVRRRLPGRRERGLRRPRRALWRVRPSGRSRRSSAIFAPKRGEIVVDAEALDLRPPVGRRLPGAGSGRRSRRRHAARERRPREGAPPATHAGDEAARGVMTLEIDVLPLPGDARGPAVESIPGRIAGTGPRRRSASTTCARGASAAIAASTTRRTAGAPAWCCGPSPSLALDRAADGRTRSSILLDPGGEVFDRSTPRTWPTRPHLILVCPRYEGVDERIRALVDLELSIGDYVLTGGELPRSSSSTRSSACCPARSTSCRPPRNRSAPACSSTRSTRGPPCSAAWTCRTILPRATTGRSRRGAASGRSNGRAPAGRTCSSDELSRPRCRVPASPGLRAILRRRSPSARPAPQPEHAACPRCATTSQGTAA